MLQVLFGCITYGCQQKFLHNIVHLDSLVMPILVTKKQNKDVVSYWKIPDMEAAIFPKMLS